MRYTALRQRMAEEFGELRADTLARDHVLAGLGERTVNQALEAGWEPKRVWAVLCESFEVPGNRR
ncbi:Protein of unknown function [Actinopolyspora xinjiangensis]|uniref:DUF3046 domain-containing protein n=1 Tax=Actinopolyspora xinjiangensis TaxID=405564 RepID=A0A1H0TI47_9ACTN|nr:DUF3046 domain-containing protein [Actinopolyspora xinjiangensis]SDP53350.1 Protein of unknown function [Actinopolyspora xinjiangensis]